MADPIPVAGVDAVYSSHSLEHLSVSDGKRALRNFYDALVPGGVLFVCVPNLENVRPTEEPIYMSEIGPITGLDMIYGMQREGDHPGMLHRTGFIPSTLEQRMEEAGFNPVVVKPIEVWSILGIGVK